MKRSLRDVLAESHVAAVAIAIFLLLAMDAAFQPISPYVSNALVFLSTAVAILDIPYISRGRYVMSLAVTFSYLYAAIISLTAAWLVSRWVYGVGPLSALGRYHSVLTGRKNA